MRISSLQIFQLANRSMADANAGIMQTQEQMSTGKRVLSPADDPVASTKILQLNDELKAIEQYKKNIDIAENNLSLEESILNNVIGITHRMKELGVAAGNTASLSENEYKAMASEVEQRLNELLNLANTKNANGDYIFGGYKSKVEPFEGDAFSGFKYVGDEGQQFIKISHNTTVAATDSGKALFMDINSSAKTVDTYASPANTSSPPVVISVGQIVNEVQYDDFYPEDMIVSFNADSDVNPPGKNYTVTERSTGKVITGNQRYVSGDSIILKGVEFKIVGSPESGTAAVPSTMNFGNAGAPVFPVDFTAPNNQSFTLTVGGRTERLVLDGLVSSTADLVTIFNDATNGNATRLANLGITVDNLGFSMPLGVEMSVANGSTAIDGVLGIDTSGGSQSDDGQVRQSGDRLFIDSTEKQGLLTTLARFKDAMENYDGSSEGKRVISDVAAATLDNIAHSQTSVLEVQAQLGARLNTIDNTRSLHLDTELVSQEIMADIRDLDYAEAATRLSQQSLVLQAAQQSFIRVSQLNLFSRL